MHQASVTKTAYGKLGLQLSLALMPLVFYLPLFLLAIPGVLVLTGWIRWKKDHNALPVGQTRVAIFLSLALGATAIALSQFALEDIAVAFFMLVASLKWLETRTGRDAIICCQLNFFTLLLPVLYDQPIWLTVLMVITTGLTLYHWLVIAHPGVQQQLPSRYLTKLFLFGLPLIAILFFLFPRFEHPLWQINEPPKAQSGISDTMNPGSMSEIVQSAEPAFRVTFTGQTPDKTDMYWRGLVLWDFDGKSWKGNTSRKGYQWNKADEVATNVSYTITLEAASNRWLYLLPPATNIQSKERGFMNMDDEFLLIRPPEGRTRYSASSGTKNSFHPLDDFSKQLGLALPFGNPKATALGQSWASKFARPEDRVQAALTLFGSAPFSYTLKPGLLGENGVDEFLFDSKKGFCEHYASAFVFLMRAAGVPARVVVGYAGGEYNQVGNYYLVRQANAHAWAEVYLENKGWVRIDPTAAIAPERVETSVLQLGDSRTDSRRTATEATWGKQLGWFADSLLNEWNSLILSYDRQKQREMLEKLGLDGDRKTLYQLIAVALGFFAMIAVIVLLWPRRRHLSEEQKLFALLCKRLKSRGFVRVPSEGEGAFIHRVLREWPTPKKELLGFLALYQGVRYGNQPLEANARLQMKSQISTLPKRSRQ